MLSQTQLPKSSLFEDSDEPEADDNVIVDEKVNSLGNPWSYSNVKVGGELSKDKNVPPKKFSSS